MTMFGTRRGPRKCLTAVVISCLALTLAPSQGQSSPFGLLQAVLEWSKPKKKDVYCPQGVCCPAGVCCPQGGISPLTPCCPQTEVCPQPPVCPQCPVCPVCPQGVCTGAAMMPCCPILAGTTFGASVNACAGLVGQIVLNERNVDIQRNPGTLFIVIAKQPPEMRVVRVEVPSEQQIPRALLERKVTFSFNNVPLHNSINAMRDFAGFKVVVDKQAIQAAGVRFDQPISINVQDMALHQALGQLLKKAHLSYAVKNQAIVITSEQQAQSDRITTTHCVADLIGCSACEKPHQADVLKIHWQTANDRSAGVVFHPTTKATAIAHPWAKPVVAVVEPTRSNAAASLPPKPTANMEEFLIRLIKNRIAPDSWDHVGGKGRIQYYPLGQALVVGQQTPEVQKQIADLLQTLRCLKSMGVSLEPCCQFTCATCDKSQCQDCQTCPGLAVIRVNKPEQCGQSADALAALDNHARELRRLSAVHEQTILELQALVRKLSQEVNSLRQDVRVIRHTQPANYPQVHQVHPASVPQSHMPHGFFFVPTMQPFTPDLGVPMHGVEMVVPGITNLGVRPPVPMPEPRPPQTHPKDEEGCGCCILPNPIVPKKPQ